MASTGTRTAARSDQGLPGPLCEDELWGTSGSALRQGHPHRGISGDFVCLFTKLIKKICICLNGNYKSTSEIIIIHCMTLFFSFYFAHAVPFSSGKMITQKNM